MRRAELVFLVLWCAVELTMGQAVPGKSVARFERRVIAPDWPGDYGVTKCDVNGDGRNDVVAYAWASGNLAWFENPASGTNWTEHMIGNYKGIVDIDFFDLDKDGRLDMVIAWDLSIPVRSDSEGQIGWLRNQLTPGAWKYRPIADNSNFIPGIHRVRIDYFYNNHTYGVVGIPIFGYGAAAPSFTQAPCLIHFYFPPQNPVVTSTAWKSVLINNELHICHTLRKLRDAQTDTAFLIDNSLEGVTRFSFDGPVGSPPQTTRLSPGTPKVSYSPFYGSQGTAVGKVNGIPAFLAQIAPWEGVDVLSPTTVAVLLPEPNQDLFNSSLKRVQLDVLGPQGHDVATGDFDNDGIDEILVGLRGPVHGVWMFHSASADLLNWTFAPVTLDQLYGASQLAVDDFNLDGLMDFAATGFPGFPGSGNSTVNHYVAVYYQQRHHK